MDLAAELCARDSVSIVDKISIYIPDRDRFGNELEGVETWIEAGLEILRSVTGGATCLPPAVGGWISDDGTVITEKTVVIYSYILNYDSFIERRPEIYSFIHKFGEQSHQDSVLVEFAHMDNGSYVVESLFIDHPNFGKYFKG